MAQSSVSKTATGTSTVIPVNYFCTGNSPIGIAMDFTTVAAVGTASVEFTQDDLNMVAAGTAVWLPITTFTGKTASFNGSVDMPMRAVRLNVTAYTSGTITLRVLYAGTN